jgi:opacity protein-like surface antigen
MFAGRLYLNQEESRVYIPMGFGLSISTLKINILQNNVSLLKEKERTSGFGWYAGLGIETETSENVVFGIEARINGNSAKIDMLNDTYHPLYLTVMARLGFKFK